MFKKLQDIHGFWVGEPLSEMEIMSMNSFLYHGHKYVLWLYEEFDGIPSGVDVRDAREIVQEDVLKLWFPSSVNHAKQTFANFFRYKLIENQGDWWCDLDIICLKPFVAPGDFLFTSVHDIPVREQLKPLGLKFNVANGCFCAPKNSDLLKSILSEIEDQAGVGDFPSLFGEWGTILFTKNIVKHGLLKHHVPFWIGHGYQLAEQQYTDPSLETPDSQCVHFYNYLGKMDAVDGSLYDRLRKRFL